MSAIVFHLFQYRVLLKVFGGYRACGNPEKQMLDMGRGLHNR